MQSYVLISLLLVSSVLPVSWAEKCDLSGAKEDKNFPDIEKEGVLSYQMSVEYTATDATQTDYYIEYYDITNRRGRVEGHIRGKPYTFIYRTESWEAWEIERFSCKLQNVTATPSMFKSDQSDWLYLPSDVSPERTIGPSAMFKVGLAAWKKKSKDSMAYMGKSEKDVRGLKAQYWRLCKDNSYVDYYFTPSDNPDESNPSNFKFLKEIPLRVVFGPGRTGEDKELSLQQYDIMTFQPFISANIKPFQLPKGRGCKRNLLNPVTIPDFAGKNLQFQSEVQYRVLDWNSGDEIKLYSYYSTLSMALDLSTQYLSFYYTKWNSSKNTPETAEPKAFAPKSVVFDMTHGYQYITDFETGNCMIERSKDFYPKYDLPRETGSINLAGPTILYPNNELTYVSEGVNRGLAVDNFEATMEEFPLDSNDPSKTVPKAYITHSYLKDNEILDNKVTVKNALAQVQLRLLQLKKEVVEITFNFFDFSTQIRNRRATFDIQRCFKNSDDYLWVTIGFDADKETLANLSNYVPSIQANFLDLIQMSSDLNAVRIPKILVDVKDAIFVTMMVLGKPPLELDYLDAERGKTISKTTRLQGVSEFEDCAQACLETEEACWGFSMCGKTCYFGIAKEKEAVVIDKNADECLLWRRYDNKTYLPSKDSVVATIRQEVTQGNVRLNIPVAGAEEGINIKATSIDVTNPGEDEEIFEKMGRVLNPRMTAYKAGFRLKDKTGTEVKNLGKLRYDECQKLCLDFDGCETVSYCLMDSSCVLINKYGEDLSSEEIVEDNTCILVTRKYADNFERSPGVVLSLTATRVLTNKPKVEDCARACMKETEFLCLSFDHCQTSGSCKLHVVHYPNSKTREEISERDANCGHYYRKYSTEFAKTANKRSVNNPNVPVMNVTLEECSKNCFQAGDGKCFGFDFCQDKTMYATSCTLISTEAGQTNISYSPICSNYMKINPFYTPFPYSNSYAGGIGFLCFIIGCVVGVGVVFLIAYIKVNRR